MTKRILLTEICRKGKIPKKNLFYHLVSDVEIKIDKEKYPNSIFFFKGDECLFEQDLKNDEFLCNYYLYWSVLEREFVMKDNEIQSFTKIMVEQHFKMRVSTPWHVWNYYIRSGGERTFKIEYVDNSLK